MKKLLILGATYSEIAIIERARAKGIYTIVTDNNTDYSKSPAKYVADEAWDISWSDIDALAEKARIVLIDGVLAGFSEFRVENMIKLCNLLNLPCTLTLEQLDITRDKIKFKNLCKSYGIDCVPEYQYDDIIKYPVIIKPVDRAGSIGINIAKTPEEFERYYQHAKSLSPTKKVIIEDFITDGIKFDTYYFVKDGCVTLLGTSDTIMCEGLSAAPILQKAWIFPSKYELAYRNSIDYKVRRMLLEVGIVNGYVTISAFYRHGVFSFFEAGFRLSGEMSFNYYYELRGINYLDSLIDFAILGKINQKYSEGIASDSHSVILNYFIKSGKVDKLLIPLVGDIPSAIASNIYVKENDIINNDTSIYKKAVMFTLMSTSIDDIYRDIDKINEQIIIHDNDKGDLIYEKLDPLQIGYKPLIQNNGVDVYEKPYFVSWQDLQSLLNDAHQSNLLKGMKYATLGQSVEQLKEKVTNSKVYVALKGDKLVGTATIQFRSINHWYHNGVVGLLKLTGVIYNMQGEGIGNLLLKVRCNAAKQLGVPLLITDSAEHNETIKHMYLKNGFSIVDCCKYPSNNFVSNVYARWTDECPWRRCRIYWEYSKKRIKLYIHTKCMTKI